MDSPEPGSIIQSPLRIRGQARVSEGIFTIEIKDGHRVLGSRVVTASDGAVAWSGWEASPYWSQYDMGVEFANPTSPNGMIILVIYHGRSSRRVEELMIPVRFFGDQDKKGKPFQQER